MNKKTDLLKIPGVGKQIKKDLIELGYTDVESLKNQTPEKIYEELNRRQGCTVDRCMLYVIRCAVYYASNENHDKEKLKWWNWKNQ